MDFTIETINNVIVETIKNWDSKTQYESEQLEKLKVEKSIFDFMLENNVDTELDNKYSEYSIPEQWNKYFYKLTDEFTEYMKSKKKFEEYEK